MNRNDILETLMPERTKQIALAWSILRESHLAEDAYQDMLIKAFENEAIFEGPRHLRDWSWKVLRNGCYKTIRDQKYRRAMLDESVIDLVDAELENRGSDDMDARADALRSCLTKLTENARNIIQLRYFEGLRGKEVAEKLGRKPDAVYKMLQRTYETLGACVQQELATENKGGMV